MFEDINKKQQDDYFTHFLMKVKPDQEKVFLSLLGESTYAECCDKLEEFVMLSNEEYNELKGGKICE